MAGRFGAVHDDGVTADGLRLQRVLDDGALMDHRHARRLEIRHEGFRRAAGGLHNADALLDADLHVGRIVRRGQRGHQGQVHGEGFIRQFPAFSDFGTELLGIWEGSGGHDAQAAGVRHRGHQFRLCQPLHRAAENRALDAEHLGDAGIQLSFHGYLLTL